MGLFSKGNYYRVNKKFDEYLWSSSCSFAEKSVLNQIINSSVPYRNSYSTYSIRKITKNLNKTYGYIWRVVRSLEVDGILRSIEVEGRKIYGYVRVIEYFERYPDELSELYHGSEGKKTGKTERPAKRKEDRIEADGVSSGHTCETRDPVSKEIKNAMRKAKRDFKKMTTGIGTGDQPGEREKQPEVTDPRHKAGMCVGAV